MAQLGPIDEFIYSTNRSYEGKHRAYEEHFWWVSEWVSECQWVNVSEWVSVSECQWVSDGVSEWVGELVIHDWVTT